MKIGLVGYRGSGKSTLFGWLTGVAPDPALAHTTQTAMAEVPDPRVDQLCGIYHPKKIVLAALELIDTPGLDPGGEGNAARLTHLRECGCLVHVVNAYSDAQPAQRLTAFDEDLLLADMEIVARRIERLGESIKKPRPDREQQQADLEALQPLLAALESGQAVTRDQMSEAQQRATRSFQLLTEKPRLVLFNLADDAAQPDAAQPEPTQSAATQSTATAATPTAALPLRLAAELAELPPEEREEFARQMALPPLDRGQLLRQIMAASGQMAFYTASEKEVRSWLIRRGATAAEAAAGIHTDLARGFVRAETMRCADLFRLGSEREVKAAGLLRREPRDYVVQEGEVLHILASV